MRYKIEFFFYAITLFTDVLAPVVVGSNPGQRSEEFSEQNSAM